MTSYYTAHISAEETRAAAEDEMMVDGNGRSGDEGEDGEDDGDEDGEGDGDEDGEGDGDEDGEGDEDGDDEGDEGSDDEGSEDEDEEGDFEPTVLADVYLAKTISTFPLLELGVLIPLV